MVCGFIYYLNTAFHSQNIKTVYIFNYFKLPFYLCLFYSPGYNSSVPYALKELEAVKFRKVELSIPNFF